jgi:carbon catabolite-derepressing protein kinase
MLAVDPVQRITIPEILEHPFFTKDLPRYLTPLPPPPGPVLGTLSALVHPPTLDFEMIDGLGRIEDDIIEDLATRMDGVDKEDIWECLRRDDGPQGNAVKVAYMLLRDKRRLGRDRKLYSSCHVATLTISLKVAEFAEQERDAQLAVMDVRRYASANIVLVY